MLSGGEGNAWLNNPETAHDILAGGRTDDIVMCRFCVRVNKDCPRKGVPEEPGPCADFEVDNSPGIEERIVSHLQETR